MFYTRFPINRTVAKWATRNFSSIAKENPVLANVSVANAGKAAAQLFHKLVRDGTEGIPLDAVNEVTRTIKMPIAVNNKYNGGVWFERFIGHLQIAHNHQDDWTGIARERFLLICPEGNDGYVDVIPRFASSPIGLKSERYIFEKNKFHLLHFDGNCGHKFGSFGEDSMLLCVAFHSRDVATSMTAIEDQTNPLKFELPKAVIERQYTPPVSTNEVIKGVADTITQKIVDATAVLHTNSSELIDAEISRLMYEISITVASQEVNYGAKDFVELSNFHKWAEYMFPSLTRHTSSDSDSEELDKNFSHFQHALY